MGDITSTSGQGTKILHAVEQLLSLGVATGVSVHCQEKTPCDTMMFQHSPTKAWWGERKKVFV